MATGDTATDDTYSFVTDHLQGRRLRILEVGCGDGALAARLKADGHDVVAIDSSATAVAAARLRGVGAVQASWPAFEAQPCDAVLFTRSLHHMRPLHAAVAGAVPLLKSGGVLVVEDFAFTEVHEHAAVWFHALLVALESTGALMDASHTFGRKLLNGGGSFALWREHVADINTPDAIVTEITRHFHLETSSKAPYFYRYVAQMVDESADGERTVAAVLALERATAAMSPAFYLGRRIVARRL